MEAARVGPGICSLAVGGGLWEAPGVKAYEEVAEFIAQRGPREVAEFRPSAEAKQRVGELLGREKTTGLTPEERRELDHYEDLELLMNLAKARARQLLAHGQ